MPNEAGIILEKVQLLLEKVRIGQATLDEVLCLLERAVELGDAEAQHQMADVHRAQDDYVTAFRLEMKSALQGHPKAQYNVAVHHRDGLGTPIDEEQEFYWYQKAAENGVTEAKCSVGLCFLHGRGTLQNFEKAFYWLKAASNEGHAAAKRNLAGIYFEGHGVPADNEKGLALLRESAALGDEKAKTVLNSQVLADHLNTSRES